MSIAEILLLAVAVAAAAAATSWSGACVLAIALLVAKFFSGRTERTQLEARVESWRRQGFTERAQRELNQERHWARIRRVGLTVAAIFGLLWLILVVDVVIKGEPFPRTLLTYAAGAASLAWIIAIWRLRRQLKSNRALRALVSSDHSVRLTLGRLIMPFAGMRAAVSDAREMLTVLHQRRAPKDSHLNQILEQEYRLLGRAYSLGRPSCGHSGDELAPHSSTEISHGAIYRWFWCKYCLAWYYVQIGSGVIVKPPP